MRRRNLFTLAAGASAVVLLAVTVLWVRSYWFVDKLAWVQPKRYWDLSTDRGTIELFTGKNTGNGGVFADPYGLRYRCAAPLENAVTSPWLTTTSEWRLAGFQYLQVEWVESGVVFSEYRMLGIPLWFVGILLLGAPIAWYVWLRKDRVRARGLRCRACGYDLRATPDRCPECGTAAVAKREPIAPRPPAR